MSDIQLKLEADWDTFCAIETEVDGAETTGVHARWRCGMMLAERYESGGGRGGSELAAAIAKLSGPDGIGASKAELYFRRQFAVEYPDEEEVSNALETYKSWREIVAQGLGKRGRGEQPTPPLPVGTYSTIIADPPWPMQKINRDVRPAQGVDALDYPTMTVEQISALGVGDLAGPNSHLYLWTTHRFLPDALEIATAWGFTYQCLMTWNKNVGITPFSWMYDTEHVLFCKRGSLALNQLGLRLSFAAPVTKHSAKPDVFYERVLAASPGPRLELFARQPREGFTVWGNEIAA